MRYKLPALLGIMRSRGIARRYFVVNGFDGALTMLGLITGFQLSQSVDLVVVINACLGVAIALGMSGVSSAYISESAEKRKELRELEQAMITDLGESDYGQATRWLPFVIALVNGLAPFLIAVLIIIPLWLGHWSVALPIAPLAASQLMALVTVFLIGVFLGRVSGTMWIWAGLRTLAVAAATMLLIALLSPRI
jgi:predicted membrane protein (TIGR00267 family)